MPETSHGLPGGARAIVTAEKLRLYLLNSRHSIGAPKARLFAQLGYGRRQWRAMRRVLLEHARAGEVTAVEETPYGRKYAVRAMLEGRSGRRVVLLSIWIIRADEDFPRLVTAYPE